MSGNKALLDSNIIILASKQQIDTDKLLSLYDEFYVSIVNYLEVYGHKFEDENEKRLINRLFENFKNIGLIPKIVDQAIVYRKIESKKIKLPDAIILATAKLKGADLLTNNPKDFQGIDDSIKVLDTDDLKI